jgi:hypothetical protein
VTHLIDVFALELFQQAGEAVLVSVDANRFEDTLDVRFGGAAIAGEAKEEISCEVLHFECLFWSVSYSPIPQ